MPLRARLLWLLALIAVYVPLAGGGASIQRAGAMGAAAIVATLAGRPASRVYALLLAVAATLALNPRASADVGWQLSFAAVVGIFVLVAPLRGLLLTRLGDGGWRRALADGLAVTVAATLATAPLMAHHFESCRRPRCSPTCSRCRPLRPRCGWGCWSPRSGQAPAVPVEPLNWVNSLLLAYIAQIAEWMAAPRLGAASACRSRVGRGVPPPTPRCWPRRLRCGAGPRAGGECAPASIHGRALRLGVAALAALAIVVGSGGRRGAGAPAPSRAGLRVTVLDVGQGDSILLQPRDGEPLLVDGGPPGDGLRGKLAELGVDSLAAAVVTHDQSDHAGGIEELMGTMPVRRLVYAEAGRPLLAAARAAGATPTRVAEGGELRSGRCGSRCCGRRASCCAGQARPQDPNTRSLVLLARWHRFEMLLTGDAEAEAVPIDPGAARRAQGLPPRQRRRRAGGAAGPQPRRGWR